jgi:NAD(P)-dependent dehydrogenase (short-subunit alcohol dehydrogenase family)
MDRGRGRIGSVERSVIRFDDEVALVTGAGRGLGRAYALLLAERGASVLVHDAGVEADGSGGDRSVADAVVRQIRATGGTAEAAGDDLGTRAGCRAAVEATVERFGRIDALVHSAGLALRRGIEDVDESFWRRSLAVNAEAAFWLVQAAYPHMRERGAGRIVLTVSGHGLAADSDDDDLVPYATAKGAQFGLMNELAAVVARDGIRVNAVSPVAATRMYSRDAQAGTLTAEQVAPGVVFLASRACAFSGVVLRAAGGRFSVGTYRGTRGVDFGPEPATPDAIAERWVEIVA